MKKPAKQTQLAISSCQMCTGQHRIDAHDLQRSVPAAMLQCCIKLSSADQFMRWQRNFALFEKLALVSAKIMLIGGYVSSADPTLPENPSGITPLNSSQAS